MSDTPTGTGDLIKRLRALDPDAINALAAYQQADEDGVMVLVSRQAIEECLPVLHASAPAADALEAAERVIAPFAELCGPYDHWEHPDDEIVRSHGTLGKGGNKGYAVITVTDLRAARDWLARHATGQRSEPEPTCSACGGTEHLRQGSPWHDAPICRPCFMVWYDPPGTDPIDQTDPAQIGALSLKLKREGKYPWTGSFATGQRKGGDDDT